MPGQDSEQAMHRPRHYVAVTECRIDTELSRLRRSCVSSEYFDVAGMSKRQFGFVRGLHISLDPHSRNHDHRSVVWASAQFISNTCPRSEQRTKYESSQEVLTELASLIAFYFPERHRSIDIEERVGSHIGLGGLPRHVPPAEYS